MKPMIFLAIGAIGTLAGCAQALAAATAQGNVSMDVQSAAAGIAVVSPLVLPTVSTTAVVPISGGVATGQKDAGPASAPLSNATLTIYGQSGDAMSMAVPETFKVIRGGGTESLTVKTHTNSQYSLAGSSVVLGQAPGSESLSVNVGGSLVMASADQLAPGAYQGLLVVVVQYN